MAATRLIALHINKGKTVAQCLADRTDYSQNAAKTEDGKYISSYECDPKTADEEFLLTKSNISISQADSRKMTSLPIRYASHLSRERLLQKKPTKSDMKQQCVGQKENTPLSWRHILIVLISITISFITPLLWTVPVNSRTFFFPGLRFSD